MRTKRIRFFFFAIFTWPAFAIAQAPPQGINYQAVARTSSGTEMPNAALTVRIGIYSDAAATVLAYEETHAVTTNAFGLFNLVIGQGTQTSVGAFNSILWANSAYYLKVEVDAGSGFVNMGTTQLMSVPYALYAGASAGGPTGPTGAAGATGPTGLAGATGATGPQGTAGAQGATGPQGPSGVAGSQGATGVTGATGAAGDSITSIVDNGNGTLTITWGSGNTVTTSSLYGPQGLQGNPGATGATGPNGFHCWDTNANGVNDPAEDVNSDGSWDALDCQGAQGIAGAVGPQGPSGATGPSGPSGANGTNGTNGATGATGPSGANGTNGTNGTNGATGPTGPSGANGTNGANGATGPTGPSGANGTNGANGAMGPSGINGTNGATGPTGPSGINGTNGANGATGPSGINGTNGTNGATGPTGPSGINGTNGANGATGPSGINGTNGATGPTGPSGINGTNGANGATGPSGANGATGATGATGAANISGTTNYLVKFTGATFGGNSQLFDNGANIGFGTTGPAYNLHLYGLPGTTFGIEAPQSGVGYAAFDIVTKGNSTTAVNNPTTKGWNLMAYNDLYGTTAFQNDLRLQFFTGTGATQVLYLSHLGKVGIGTTAPAVAFHTEAPGVTSSAEGVARFSVADAGGSYLEMGNATTIDNIFMPKIYAMQQGTLLPSLTIEADNNNDAGTFPVILINGKSGGDDVGFRPLFGISDDGVSRFLVDQDGNTGIGLTPSGMYRLEVAGGVSMTSFNMATGAVNGYVLVADGSGNGTWQNLNSLAGGNWIQSGTNIYNGNGGFVGVGLPNPGYKFHVYQTGITSGYMSYYEASGAATGTMVGLGSYTNSTGTGDAMAIQGNAAASTANAYGGSFFAQGGGAGAKIGVEGTAAGSTSGNYGVRGFANSATTGSNYGVYGSAQSGATNWAGYFANGNVFVQNSMGVGIIPSAKLTVRGTSTTSANYTFRAESSTAATLFVVRDDGFVGIGTTTGFKLSVNGNVGIPATSTYRYNTAKTKKYKVSAFELISVNPAVYQSRIDDGFSSATVNGLNSMWATGGTAGTVAYFVCAVHLPDSAVITGLAAQLVKNGGSLQSVVELYRTDGTGYLSNTAQLIATCTTTNSGGGVAYVNAASVSALYNVVDNTNYTYFIRYSGEQNTQNLRFHNATITYQIYRSDY
jgi:hypothetical protein